MSANPHTTTARYRVIEQAYIDNELYEASTDAQPVFVDYAGHPGTALEPTDEEGRARKAAYFQRRGRTPDQALADKRRLTLGAFEVDTPSQPEGLAG